MNLRRNFKNALFLVIVLYIAICFFSIALLERAFPDVPRELRTHQDVQQSLHKLTGFLIPWDQSTPEQRTARAQEELQQLRSLLPEPATTKQLDLLAQNLPKAIAGEPLPLMQTMETIRSLAQTQHVAAESFSERLQQTSLGTAWTLALCALLGLSLTTVLMFRLKQRVLDPFCDLLQLFDDWKHGNRHRRFNTHILQAEIRDSIETLNEILDQNQTTRTSRSRLQS